MARLTLNVIGSQITEDLLSVERAVKKFFPPKFIFAAFGGYPIGSEALKKAFPETQLYERHSELERHALACLRSNADSRLALCLKYGSVVLGPDMPTQLSIRAVLVEVRKKEGETWPYAQIMAFASEYSMPNLGTQSWTSEQVRRGKSTVLRAVIEGWKVWSESNGGILSKQIT